MAKKPGIGFESRLDWYYVSRRGLYRVVLGFVAALALVVGGVWYFTSRDTASLKRAREEIQRAEELLSEARQLKEADRFGDELTRIADAISEARKLLTAHDTEKSRTQAVTAQQLARNVLSGRMAEKGDANVIELAGKVELQRANMTKWETLRPGTALREGDFLKTGANGTAEVMASDGTLYRIKPETLFEVHRAVTVGEGKASSAKTVVGAVDVDTGEGTRSILTTDATRTDIARRSSVGVETDATSTGVSTYRGQATLSTSGGKSVTLGERERAVALKEGGAIGEKQRLPEPPLPLEPEDNARFELGKKDVTIRWASAKDVTAYQLQIARSRLFVPDSITKSGDFPRTTTEVRLKVNERGLYFWRLQAVRREPRELASGWSAPRRFKVVSPDTNVEKTGVPPDLVVYRPQVIGNAVIVSGKTEPGATVTVAGETADMDATGVFRKVITLSGEGVRTITIRAVNAAGLETLRKESVLIQN
jgi:hypothetical protein